MSLHPSRVLAEYLTLLMFGSPHSHVTLDGLAAVIGEELFNALAGEEHSIVDEIPGEIIFVRGYRDAEWVSEFYLDGGSALRLPLHGELGDAALYMYRKGPFLSAAQFLAWAATNFPEAYAAAWTETEKMLTDLNEIPSLAHRRDGHFAVPAYTEYRGEGVNCD